MKTVMTIAIAIGLAPAAWAQGEGAAERAGKSLDRAATSIRKGVENAVDTVTSSVEQKELQTRTYYRIHWDRTLNKAPIQVDVSADGSVVLRGSVTDAAAKSRAVDLAHTTVGVKKVVDQLAVGPVKVKTVPSSPPTPDRKTPPVKNTEIKPSTDR
jgi:hypothetical protein